MIPIGVFPLALLLIYGSMTSVWGAKILAIFPYAGPSQYIAAERYLKALSERGHELTVISQFPQKQKITNFRDITIKTHDYEDLIRATMTGDTKKQMAFFENFFRDVTLSVLDNAAVQEVLHSKAELFDLVITEVWMTEALYAISSHFKAHLIGFSSYGTDAIIDQWTGNPSPLSYIPITTTDYTDRMNFWQRLNNFIQASLSFYFVNQHFNEQRTIYRKYFPHLDYELEDICKNFSLVLLNQHFTLNMPRPYVPNLIEVGGLYLDRKPSPLPDEIRSFIEGAEHGVVYFSMGSNVKSAFFDAEKRSAVLNVLGSLKQRVLWKFEDTELPGKPSNVMIKKWFPQPDILAHPNVKLFITHGGLLSITETICHGKPIVGIPIFFDQFANLVRAQNLGFGIAVRYGDLTETALKEAVLEVLNNGTYTKAVRAISKRYHDQPVKPLDLAIYWTEYVLRHDGAPFMRVAARELNFFQYFCLDVISFILAVLILGLFVLCLLLWGIVEGAMKLFRSKNKKKSE